MRKIAVAQGIPESKSHENAKNIIREYCKGCDPSGVQYALERMFLEYETARQKQELTISGLRQTLTGLREALQALYDVQNGPPPKRTKRRWEAAMKLAEAAIGAARGVPSRGGVTV